MVEMFIDILFWKMLYITRDRVNYVVLSWANVLIIYKMHVPAVLAWQFYCVEIQVYTVYIDLTWDGNLKEVDEYGK